MNFLDLPFELVETIAQHISGELVFILRTCCKLLRGLELPSVYSSRKWRRFARVCTRITRTNDPQIRAAFSSAIARLPPSALGDNY
mgnify:CR=1 FL=1